MNKTPKQGFALKSGEGIHIDFYGTQMDVKVSGEQSAGAYALIEMRHKPNVGPALHVHPQGAEAFYVLEGTYTIRCEQESYTAKAGDFVFVPSGVPHNYQSGPNGGKVLVLSPAGLENYFAKVADMLKIGPIPWDIEQAIAKEYGQEFLEHLKHWGQ